MMTPTPQHSSKPTRKGASPGRARGLLVAPAVAVLLIVTACATAEHESRATMPRSEPAPATESPPPEVTQEEEFSLPQEPGESEWDGLASPVGMAYDADGTLYIANWSGGTIERFTADGERSTFASGLSGPSGLAIADDGTVYAASYNGNVVWRFSADGDPEVFVDGLSTPAGLSFNSAGELLIANRVTNEILAADADGRTRVVATGLQTPVGAVELDNGDLMISNINGGISLVSGDREAVEVNTELASPGPGIAPAGGNAVYVVDYGGTTVDMIEPDGTRTTIADGFSSPTSVTLAPDGRLAVADWGTNSLYLIRSIH